MRALIVFSALGGFLFGYDTGVVAGAMLFIDVAGCDVPNHACTTSAKSAIVAVALIAAGCSSLLGGTLSTRWGRKRTIIFSSVLFIGGGLGLAAAPDLGLLLVARVVVGLAIGISSQTVPVYIAEMSPPNRRGSMVAFFQLMITLGILVAAIVDLVLASSQNWRLMFGLSVVPALLMALGMLAMPESPRWLVSRGRDSEALKIVERSTTQDAARREIAEFGAITSDGSTGISEMSSRAFLLPLRAGVSLQCLAQFQGINTVIYFAPSILKMANFDDAAAIGGLVAVDVVNVVVTIVSVLYMERLNRRTWLFISSPGMMASLLALALGFSLADGAARSILLLSSLVCYVAFFCIGWGPLPWLVNSEIFALRMRGVGTGITTFACWAANTLVSFTFLLLVDLFGARGCFILYASVGAVALGFVWRMMPETRGRTLEEIEAFFASRSAAARTTEMKGAELTRIDDHTEASEGAVE